MSYTEKNNITFPHIEYERFTHGLRDNCISNYYKMKETFKINIPQILKRVHYGDPCKSKLLQFADFWAFIPYSKKNSEILFEKFRPNFGINSMKEGLDGNYFIN